MSPNVPNPMDSGGKTLDLNTDGLLATLSTRLSTSASRLVVVAGAERGQHIPLRKGTVLIGSDPKADLVLSDPAVSRKHATVTAVDGGMTVVDQGSTNGTFFEGARIRDATIPHGGVVTVGLTQLKVVPEEDAVQLGPSALERFHGLLGQDRRMREIFTLLQDLAQADTTVLIEGETGTGKELVARAIHDESRRKNGPWIVFDCSAVPRDLVESALFGHVKGAFTGAAGARQGAFRAAHGGTLFLDEIGELPLDLQPRLLRVLESRTVQAVGQDSHEKVDVRVLAATNRTLRGEVRAGRFREDLYYRLAVVRVPLPPLRERTGDIPMLARHFLNALDLEQRTLDAAGLTAAARHPFHGNVRELKNLVERAARLTPPPAPIDLARFLTGDEEETGPRRAAPPLPPGLAALAGAPSPVEMAVPAQLPFKDAKAQVLDAFERRYLETLMTESGGNLTRAALRAQVDRKHLRDLLRRHGLRTPPEE